MITKKKSRLLKLSIVVFFVAIYIVYFWWSQNLKPVDDKTSSSIVFVVKKGSGIKEIAKNLEDKKLIRNSFVFTILVRKMGLQNIIQAGEFRLSASYSAERIATELTHGTTDVWLTIPEGLRNEEIAEKVNEVLKIPIKDFLKLEKEGYMYPDTYLFPKDTTAELVAQTMRENFNKRIKTLDQDFLLPGKKYSGLTFDEIVIMASIIEREAKYDDDRYLISGILHKRLMNEWPLEVDATLQYVLGYQSDEKTWWKKNITADDLLFDSRFNTRKYKGLPEAPICNPGLSSIKASMRPKESQYWFYLSDKTGKMYYAKTLEEHILNTRKYL